jgi:hypothetical protein
MQNFTYTYKQGKAARDGSGVKKTVVIHEIINNVPHKVAERTDTFVDEFQLVLDAMEDAALLPPAAFVRRPNTGSRINNSPEAMEAAGFARITRL